MGERFTIGEVGRPWRGHLSPWMGCKAVIPTSLLHRFSFIYLFVFIWLHWVFVAACELSLAAMLWILTVTASLVQSMGSRVCWLH